MQTSHESAVLALLCVQYWLNRKDDPGNGVGKLSVQLADCAVHITHVVDFL